MMHEADAGVILSLDVGSSSVRCSAFEICWAASEQKGEHRASKISSCVASSRRLRRSVDSQGRIAWRNGPDSEAANLLDVIDECVDEVLTHLQQNHGLDGKRIKGVGLSTFAMNLVGVNRLGKVIGEVATMSYACQIPEVNAEVEKLKR